MKVYNIHPRVITKEAGHDKRYHKNVGLDVHKDTIIVGIIIVAEHLQRD
jgi:hypothetical protein